MPVADQIIRGRIPSAGMLAWLTPEEKATADSLIARIQDEQDSLTIEECERLMGVGERRVFTWQQVEAFLGIS